MLEREKSILLVVDVQGKLAQLMDDKEALFKNIQILIQAAKILAIPIIWCQQKPEALGPTVPQIAELLKDYEPVNKLSFSCCGDGGFQKKVGESNRRQILLCGIETHVCIYQTAMDLLKSEKQVYVIADAVSSRSAENKALALQRMTMEGAKLTSTEMAIFEILRTAEDKHFRDVARLVK